MAQIQKAKFGAAPWDSTSKLGAGIGAVRHEEGDPADSSSRTCCSDLLITNEFRMFRS